ncbi:hypothetical protein ZIOFF_059200 [Zingiber officinale]|uniref:Uncharacterized protein n=1 Tax=Zingiber officinale TaxID=94328 RepID=A0A8J5KMG8_ZINOF|nr:hypothetical protein ZIOFF_059200 [Zingiber officinale]
MHRFCDQWGSAGDRGEEMAGTDGGVRVPAHHPPPEPPSCCADLEMSLQPPREPERLPAIETNAVKWPPAPRRPHSFTVSGSIDGKFEYGYMVTVKIGTETLRGVLYHVQSSRHQLRHLQLLKVRAKDKAAAAPPRPCAPEAEQEGPQFLLRREAFQAESSVPSQGESWSKLNEKDRMVRTEEVDESDKANWIRCHCESDLLSSILFIHVHQDFGIKDKERYKKEIQEHKERLKLAQLEESK